MRSSSCAAGWSSAFRRRVVVVPSAPPAGPRGFRTTTSAATTDGTTSRRERIGQAKPFSDFLTDTFHRQHDYLRISVTERCNLRCLYCMPEEGVPLSPKRELLTTAEIVLLSSLFVSQGVNKIRLTGGEPTVRHDILPLMRQMGGLRSQGLKELCITTNGISLHRKLDSMVEAGLTAVNLSLDTLDPWQFQIMTRRKGFEAVRRSIDRVLEMNRLGAGVKLKVNCVVMRGVNDGQILPFVEMTRDKDMEIRFIEYMPFDGNRWSRGKMMSYSEMMDLIRTKYPDVRKGQTQANETSKTWQIPGFAGRIGFITSMTHNFCGSCNRLRITTDGNLKVCLFGNAEVSLRDILRRNLRGHEQQAEKPLAMTVPNEAELVAVIGTAVKGKKAKHAGLGELEHMKNRPMILIDRGTEYSRTVGNPLDGGIMTTAARPTAVWSGSGWWWRQRHVGALGLPTAQSRLLSAYGKELSHVSEAGAARMVSIADKKATKRVATAACSVRFSDPTAGRLVEANANQKGDVLAVARIAGIMAAKRTADLIPLCHPIAISHVEVDVKLVEGGKAIEIRATVGCDGKTGVEMEALTAASTAALTVYDMCKAVDKKMRIEALRVLVKDGGRL
ncbi:hypothetical protein L249_8429 [Ophiocordyceps polyrhachis-furcata BCC 54312]|uniref:Molybdenum cofactor biosynthesis protein 1 n=1 Tax=Ophiocordyceps polyrhachis-furcata BCC 54312 TaxID=1330021 RepID=A0A367L646_9HYPO|nr:hypothetical protein L249_8429 [Ophiocordyceps polyrhachis-furcata BCC 54312]